MPKTRQKLQIAKEVKYLRAASITEAIASEQLLECIIQERSVPEVAFISSQDECVQGGQPWP